jgi:type VI protein secretion system component VasF
VKTVAKSKQKNEFSIRRVVWIAFLLFVAVFIVYLYRLQTRGQLVAQLLKWTDSGINAAKKNPYILLGILSYLLVFYGGYATGLKKQRKK